MVQTIFVLFACIDFLSSHMTGERPHAALLADKPYPPLIIGNAARGLGRRGFV